MLYLLELELFTRVSSHLASFKQKSITCFIVCFNFSCGTFIYRVEKSKVETEEALFILFSLLIAENTASILRTGQSVLTPEKKKDLV